MSTNKSHRGTLQDYANLHNYSRCDLWPNTTFAPLRWWWNQHIKDEWIMDINWIKVIELYCSLIKLFNVCDKCHLSSSWKSAGRYTTILSLQGRFTVSAIKTSTMGFDVKLFIHAQSSGSIISVERRWFHWRIDNISHWMISQCSAAHNTQEIYTFTQV